MTVATTAAKAGPYTGNNVASSFAFAFKVFADADVRVVETLIATEVETDLALNSDYTVTRNADQDNNPGGSITYKVASVTTALPSTKTLTIVGALEYEQPTDIPNGGAWFASVIENALDRLTLLTKQLKEATDRAVKVPVSSSTNPDDLVASVTASEAAAAASAASAASSAAAAAAAVPSGALGFTPVNITGDTMTGELALPSIKLNGGASVTSFGDVVTKSTGAALGNVPLWDYLPLNSTLAKSAAYAVASTDRGKLIDCTTGTWALSFDPTTATGLGAGFAFAVHNSGTGTITLKPTSGTLDGAATVLLYPGNSCFVLGDGTNARTVGLYHAATIADDKTASRDFVSTFTNSSDHEITAMVSTAAAGAAIGLTGFVNGVPCQFAYTNVVGVQIGLSLTVPPGGTYNVQASSGAPVLAKWIEVL